MRVVKGAFALFAGLFALMAGPVTAGAVSSEVRYTEGLIDPGRNCSVTIHEYVSNNGDAVVRVDGNMVETEGMLPDGAVPVCDVGFSCMKIADLCLSQADASGNISSAEYSALAPSLSDLLAELRVLSSADPDRKYQPDEIMNLINEANAVSAASVSELAAKYGMRLPDTDEEGQSYAGSLTQGIYLFAETKSPEGGVPCDPFCVVLPQTNISGMSIDNKTYDPGEIWLYDISVYPKSRSVSIQKAIAIADKNEKGEIIGEKYESNVTACIGDTIKFVITADVPRLTDGTKNRLYVIEDNMEQGLTYAGDISLTFGERADTSVTLTKNSDYKLDASDPCSMKVIFTKKGLARLNETGRESHVYIRYSAVLNENAVIAEPGSMNSASLLYGTDHSDDIKAVSGPVTVYTYKLTLKKTFSPSQDHFGDVRFSLSDGNEKMYFVKESDGVYHTACDHEEYDQTALTSPNDSTGVLVLKGLANGIYTLTEEETIPEYSLLGESIEISIRNRNMSYDVENRKSIDLVHTGGKGLIPVLGSASIMIIVGLWIIFRALCGSPGRSQRIE